MNHNLSKDVESLPFHIQGRKPSKIRWGIRHVQGLVQLNQAQIKKLSKEDVNYTLPRGKSSSTPNNSKRDTKKFVKDMWLSELSTNMKHVHDQSNA